MEGKPCSVLDITGLAQRNGAVTSHIRFIVGEELEVSTRIPEGSADLVLAADLVVAAGAQVLPTLSASRSAVVYNSYVAPTSAFALDADLSFDTEGMEAAIAARTREGESVGVNATPIASKLLGNAIGANSFLLGVAWQRGLIPLALESLERAIELNGAAVLMNQRAFRLGRLSVVAPEKLDALLQNELRNELQNELPHEQPDRLVQPDTLTLDKLIEQRVAWLTDYQNAAYAERYRALVSRVAEAEKQALGTEGALAEAVARYYAKLLAYKDEYEVARLYTRPEFLSRLREQFDGKIRLGIHLAPPLLSKRNPETGRYKKVEFGAWLLPAFKLLAGLKVLRGTALDFFGYSSHRRLERQLIVDYEALVEKLLASLTPGNHGAAVKLAQLPEQIRGYDVVKEASVKEAARRQDQLLAEFANDGVQVVAAVER